MSRRLAVLLALIAAPARADDWPQWLGPQRDGVWREAGVLDKFPAGGPKVRWRVPVGEGYSGPSVAGGRVFLTDWVPAPKNPRPQNAFDAKTRLQGSERVRCFDQATGRLVWQREYECPYQVSYAAGPRCSPVVEAGRVYTLGTMGHLKCFEAADGKEVWSVNFVTDLGARVPLWGFAAHPLLDGDRLVTLVGGETDTGSVPVVFAFDKTTGKVVWKALSAREPGYCPPMIYDLSGKRTLVVWHPEALAGLEPETGKELWSYPFTAKAALSIPTPRAQNGKVFITSFYNSAAMVRPAAGGVEEVWRGKGKGERPAQTQTLHSIMVTPFWVGDHIYGVDSYGELRCLKAETGERVWTTLKATSPAGKEKAERWGNAFLVRNGDRFFIFNEHGELVIARLTPAGYEELDRAKLVEPTNPLVNRPVVWTHPAYAGRCVFARNDKELVCASLAAE